MRSQSAFGVAVCVSDWGRYSAPAMPSQLRWGILGTGNIAKQFAHGLHSAERGQVAAVGSRSLSAAQEFGRSFGIAACYGSYDGLLADTAVDAIYLSLPNSLHREWTIKALRAGKHVLCEKPFAMDAAESEEMFDVAGQTGRVLIEAFMYRCHPQTRAILDAVRGGRIGELQLIRTSFCYRTTRIAGNVRFDRKLGGGALMDVGCYCLNFSRLLAAAEPGKLLATAKFHVESGVDEITGATLHFPGDVIATFSCGMSVQADNTAEICGTEGYLEVVWPWKPQPGKGGYTLARSIPPRQDLKTIGDNAKGAAHSSPRETIAVDVNKDLYALEADAFAEAVLDAATPFVTAQDTLGNMRALDEIRRQVGLSFD
jgi:predicted dehydrogenase